MSPIGALLTAIYSMIVILSPRRIAPFGVFFGLCYMTQGQMVTLGGFHFTGIRVVLLFGFLRVLFRGELKNSGFNVFDKLVLLYSVGGMAIHYYRMPTSAVMVAELGICYNILLSYYVFRGLFQNYQEVENFLPGLAVAIVPMALAMISESLNGRNVFAFLGSVGPYGEFRNGHFRCSAAFRSPITGGTFGETLMPLFVGLYLIGKKKNQAMIGIGAALIITMCSRSSGPLLAFGGGVLALLFWRFRDQMKFVRWSILIALLSLNMIMKAPVWFLMGRISDVVGGGGYHRSEIVDVAIKHFREWWFVGTDDTADWMPTQLIDGGADLTNEFVAAGVRGGVLCMLFLIWTFVKSYKWLGLTRREATEHNMSAQYLLWGMGASLFGTIMNFFSVSYFDQIETVWYFLIAIIASSTFNFYGELQNVPVDSSEEMQKVDGLTAEPLS